MTKTIIKIERVLERYSLTGFSCTDPFGMQARDRINAALVEGRYSDLNNVKKLAANIMSSYVDTEINVVDVSPGARE